MYSNTFDASFHFDDFTSIVRNGSLRDLRTQWPPSGTRWLGYLSFALNYRVGGLDVWGYHLANTLIHLCNGLLVFWLTALTLRTPAMQRAEAGRLVRSHLPLAAGLLFVVHPVQTQAVTYVVQRFTSLATLFYLLSLVLYARARLSPVAERASKVRAASLYCLSLVFAAAAMKTKEMSVTLPFVAAAYELIFFRARRRLLLAVPLAATALLVPLGLSGSGQKLTAVLGDASRLAETQEIPRWVYLLTESRVVVTYLRLLLLPVRQNLDYDFRLSHSLADPTVLFALAVLLAVAVAAAFLLVRARKTNRAAGALVCFGAAWFFVTLSVESSVIPISDVIFEHRMYLPLAGAAVAMGAALLSAVERLRSRISVGIQCGAALLVTAAPLGAATYARNFAWRDELTLWSDVVAKSPRKARPHQNLGNALLERGKTSEAVRELLTALSIAPGYADALNDLGAAYNEQGRIDEAIPALRKAVALEPGYANAHINLGSSLQAKGWLDDAMREYREALRLDPSLATAHNNLGNAFDAKGQAAEAAREYREAIRLDPSMAQAHHNLGVIYFGNGQLDDAIREYREAIRLDPGLAEPHEQLGLALETSGRVDDAVHEYLLALKIRPADAEALDNLGNAFVKQGRHDDAITAFEKAVAALQRQDSGSARGAGSTRLDAPARLAATRTNLGIALEGKGRLDDAEREYREAIRLAPRLPEAHSNLGDLLTKQGRAREAVDECRRALELKDLPEFVFNWARALEAAGRRREAIAGYKRYLDAPGYKGAFGAEAARNRIEWLRASHRAPER